MVCSFTDWSGKPESSGAWSILRGAKVYSTGLCLLFHPGRSYPRSGKTGVLLHTSITGIELMRCTAKPFSTSAEAWTASIDYYTGYWPAVDLERVPEAEIFSIINEEADNGQRERASRNQGIDWFGAGGCYYGSRGDERWVRLSGDRAARSWRVAQGADAAVRRVDCAVTCRFAAPQPEGARAAFAQWERLPAGFGQPTRARLVATKATGDTFYLGSRQSEAYLRLYDYGAAHGTDRLGAAWRFEVEAKGRLATRWAALLSSSSVEQIAAAGLVYAAFCDRRVEVPFEASALRGEIDTEVESPLAAKLEWLSTQVRPTVGRLIELGYLEEVIERLGLRDVIPPTQP